MARLQNFYVHYNGSAVFVKEAEFFKSQGGLKSDWGNGWYGPIKATSISDARVKGYEHFGISPKIF